MEVHYNRGSKCQMTIKEIAKLAGVSSAAVSRYLNGGYVSDEKKEQIKKVIEETGYQPSAQARMLRTKKACLIGVVVPKINSESISRITAGIEKVLSERNYQMLLAGTDNTPVKEIEYMRLFENYPVDGIILVGTMITAEHRSDNIQSMQIAFIMMITVQERPWDVRLRRRAEKRSRISEFQEKTRQPEQPEKMDSGKV